MVIEGHRRVLVTGSTSGIGEAVAVAFARDGHTVFVNGRFREGTEAAAARVARLAGAASDRVVAAPGDVAADEGAAAVCRAAPDVDVLVNNAGVFDEVPAFDISDAQWRRVFEVNVLAGVRLTRHYAPAMVDRGWGRVVFVSSECAVLTPKEMIHYGMSKTAQLAVSRGFALEVAGSGVTVNSVLPGPTRTPGAERVVADAYPGLSFEEAEARFFEQHRPTSLLRRFILPAEVAAMIHHIGSDAGSATTGAALCVDGGVIPALIP
ncbi:SDR family NAD(P)-dependent oxidoreductase [Streptomyces sp. NPDC057939]|uniref:SDR family NAD(P)-dependent oxidoreductase n=1 Tax=Streptomyces sp. NPDC057939 TaxID=3346284 RepID=UPI0036E2E6BD